MAPFRLDEPFPQPFASRTTTRLCGGDAADVVGCRSPVNPPPSTATSAAMSAVGNSGRFPARIIALADALPLLGKDLNIDRQARGRL
jgi:hypothetical protein